MRLGTRLFRLLDRSLGSAQLCAAREQLHIAEGFSDYARNRLFRFSGQEAPAHSEGKRAIRQVDDPGVHR